MTNPQPTEPQPTQFLTEEDTDDRVIYWADSVSFWFRCAMDATTPQDTRRCETVYRASRKTLIEAVQEELKSQ